MTTIPLSVFSHVRSYDSPHDYGDIFVQGGTRGIVIDRANGTTYRTAFVECAPAGSFIRGEGTTIEEADAAAWAKLQAYLNCPAHEWAARGYRNGGGFCVRCGQFGSGVITPDQLGLFCTGCGVPTFHTLAGQSGTESRCVDHDPHWLYVLAKSRLWFMDDDDGEPGDKFVYGHRLKAAAQPGSEPDTEALAWAYKHLPPGWDKDTGTSEGS